MNIFDIIVILFILMFSITGFKRGVIKEGVSFIGILIVFFISYTFKGTIGNLLCKILPFLTFSGQIKGLISLNIIIYQLVGFIILFSLLLTIYHVILFASKIVQKLLNLTLIFIIPSKILGALIGFIEGYLVSFIVLLVLMLPLSNSQLFTDSKSINYIIYESPITSLDTKDIALSVLDAKDLILQIEDGSISINEANLHLIDVMLKYEMVNINTIEQLKDTNKLDSINGLDKIVNKYK